MIGFAVIGPGSVESLSRPFVKASADVLLRFGDLCPFAPGSRRDGSRRSARLSGAAKAPGPLPRRIVVGQAPRLRRRLRRSLTGRCLTARRPSRSGRGMPAPNDERQQMSSKPPTDQAARVPQDARGAHRPTFATPGKGQRRAPRSASCGRRRRRVASSADRAREIADAIATGRGTASESRREVAGGAHCDAGANGHDDTDRHRDPPERANASVSGSSSAATRTAAGVERVCTASGSRRSYASRRPWTGPAVRTSSSADSRRTATRRCLRRRRLSRTTHRLGVPPMSTTPVETHTPTRARSRRDDAQDPSPRRAAKRNRPRDLAAAAHGCHPSRGRNHRPLRRIRPAGIARPESSRSAPGADHRRDDRGAHTDRRHLHGARRRPVLADRITAAPRGRRGYARRPRARPPIVGKSCGSRVCSSGHPGSPTSGRSMD